MVDRYGNWQPDYWGQQPWMDPQYSRLYGQQQPSGQTAQQQPMIQTRHPMMQNQQPVMTQQAQSNFVSDNSNIIWVSDAKEADSYPLAPNSAVEMRDKNNQFLYVKQRDASGRPNMETYRLTPVDLSQAVTAPVQAAKSPAVEYVPVERFDALAARCDAMAAELEALKNKPCKCEPKKTKEEVKYGESV